MILARGGSVVTQNLFADGRYHLDALMNTSDGFLFVAGRGREEIEARAPLFAEIGWHAHGTSAGGEVVMSNNAPQRSILLLQISVQTHGILGLLGFHGGKNVVC